MINAPNFSFADWSTHHLSAVEQALGNWVANPLTSPGPAGLGEVMRYAVLVGGKRLRPLLVLAACQAVDGKPDAALRAACAVELIHAYSLVHDDMPCMDNDLLRRGKPTVHVKYGQAQALLAGDALQALAFEILTAEGALIDVALQAKLCRTLAQAAGFQGMAGGQAIDLASVGMPLDSGQLHEMHRLKTGALLQASVLMGASCGNASLQVMKALGDYGACTGLAFQVVDDVLDVTGNSATLGKTAGKDAAQAKPTFVSIMGLAGSQAYAQQLHDQALTSLDTLEEVQASSKHATSALRALADMLINRQH